MSKHPFLKLLKQSVSDRYFLIMTIVFVIAIIVRSYFFIGFGRGDDPLYVGVTRLVMDGGLRGLNLNVGFHYRIGVYLPMSLFFTLFGINDISFALLPLLASLGSIIVIYFIGKELFGKETGVIAAILMTFCPFDAVFASTMVIDIIASFFAALSFLLFLKGHNEKSWRYILYFIFASIVMFYNYFVKIPSVLMLCCLAIITLINIRAFKRHLVFYGSFIILLLSWTYADYHITGKFLNQWHTELTQSGRAMGPYWWVWLEYLKWMFYRMPDGSLPFGYFYHATILALLYIGVRRLKYSYPIIIWALIIFSLMEFIPKQWKLPYEPSPRDPRYIHTFLIPSALILAAGFYELMKFKKTVFIAVLVPFLTSFIIEACILYKTWVDPFSDMNEASRFLVSLNPKKTIYSDHWFHTRFNFDSKYKKGHLIPWTLNGKHFQWDIIEKKNFNELWKIRRGYVVAGGSRGIYVGMFSILNLNGNEPPQNWKLIKEIPKELTSYRTETLKIYEVLPPAKTEKHVEHD